MKPLVGILCTTEYISVPEWGELCHQAVFQQYIDAVVNAANCIPLLIPTQSSYSGSADNYSMNLMRNLNGVLLPGSSSNIATELYSDTILHVGSRDPFRDEVAMALIRAAATTGTPLLGVCRGMQEINVAFGGTLMPALHECEGKMDHRSNRNIPLVERYRAVHRLLITEKAWIKKALDRMNANDTDHFVNSLHGQGIEKLGNELTIDAYCEDKTIEAISHIGKGVEIFGVQWHPEWHIGESIINMLVWQKFGDICRENYARKN